MGLLFYTNKSLDTKLGKGHGYCLKINNDQVYNSISRSDEEMVLVDAGWTGVLEQVMCVRHQEETTKPAGKVWAKSKKKILGLYKYREKPH